MNSNEDDAVIIKSDFGHAKTLSDFLGMITRLVFVIALIFYCLKNISGIDNFYNIIHLIAAIPLIFIALCMIKLISDVSAGYIHQAIRKYPLSDATESIFSVLYIILIAAWITSLAYVIFESVTAVKSPNF